MRVCIVYFSQTGNTQKIAEIIQKQMAELAGHCAMLRLEEADPDIFSRYDLAGLGLPSFYFREPANVKHFFKLMPDQKAGGRPKPFFFFVTHGGTPGDTYSRVHRLAALRGLETMGFYQCLGVDSYPPFADRSPPTAAGHPDEKDLAEARDFASGVIHNARTYLNGSDWNRPGIPGNILSRLASGLFNERFLHFMMRRRMLPAKIVRQDKCSKCGLCVESCPQSIISLRPYPVIDQSRCIACYHCQRICPENAIECDWRVFKLLTGEYFRQRKHKSPID